MKIQHLKHFAFVSILFCCTLSSMGQTNWNQILKTVSSTRDISRQRGSSDNFGQTVAIDGEYAVVGIPLDDEDASGYNAINNAGSALIFKNIAGVWTPVKKIVPANRAVTDYFGFSVAISGNTIVVGAYLEDEDAGEANTLSNSGSVYVFSKDQGGTDNWGQVKKIVAADRAANDQFGVAVAINGSTIVVGAFLEDEDAGGANTASSAGSAYVFSKDQGGTDNWGQVKKIVAADRAANDQFGFAVAISGSTIVIGANQEDEDAGGANTASSAGSAYIFSKDQGGTDNWGQVKKIVAADRAANDQFGVAVAINSSTIVVGAFFEDEDAGGANTASSAGSAYVFSKDQGGTDNWGQVKKIVAADRAANDQFGYAVAISGSTIVVSAYQEDEDAGGANTASSAGSAYIFSKDQGGTDNWGQVKKIVAADRAANDQFGFAVAINGSTIVVGANFEDEDANGAFTISNAGSAYFFSKDQGGTNNWGQTQKIVSEGDPIANQYFGSAIAIDGDYAVVGAYEDHTNSTGGGYMLRSGSAYVLKNENGVWQVVKKLVAADRAANDRFGFSVAISGTTVVVGAYNEDEDANGANTFNDAGSAYIFSKDQGGTNNWGQVKKIVAADRATGDFFGNSVAISGDIVMVGANLEDEDAAGANTQADAGSVYIFSKDQGGTNNWGQVKKIVAADRASSDNFGYAMAISGNILAVGAIYEDQDATGGNTITNSGSVYIFSKDQGGANNWGQVKKIVAGDRGSDDRFGFSVAISGNTVAVGAFLEDEDASGANTASGAGSAYIFSKDQGGTDNWGQVRKIVAADRASGDYFGYAVAISNNILVVGSWLEDEDASGANTVNSAGSAYIFSKDQGGTNNWGQVKKIVASDRAAGDQFGHAVAIHAGTILIGAINNDLGAIMPQSVTNSGSVYFFKDCSSNTLPSVATQSIGETINAAARTFTDANCNIIATVTANGASPVSGTVSVKVWNATAQPATYVKRHYEITPGINAATATGRVTLYYTQAEFDSYNNFPNAVKLPQNPMDNTGKSNLRIEKRSGTSSDGTGLPGTYSGSVVMLDPADTDIVWNAVESRWEVSIDVTGFSGFFAMTEASTLPVNWLSFNAELNNSKQAVLNWKVEETEVQRYEVEMSTNAAAFRTIGQLQSRGNGQHAYQFTQQMVLNGTAWYRIKQIDLNGKFTYSSTVRLTESSSGMITVYPKPAVSNLTLAVGTDLKNTTVQLINMNGKLIKSFRLTGQTAQLSVSDLTAGTYLLVFSNGRTEKFIKQ